ncbi:MAG: VOC family protein [Candidatus Methanofastidiosia archaeon]
MANTFDWFEIKVRNMEKTANFYRTLFGWKIIEKGTAEGSDYWIFDTGDEPNMENIRRGAIWLRPDDKDTGVVIYIAVGDIGAVLRKATELGGKLLFQKLTSVLPLKHISKILMTICLDSGRRKMWISDALLNK